MRKDAAALGVSLGALVAAVALGGLASVVQAPTASPVRTVAPVRVVFAGDIMLDRNVAKWGAGRPETLFADVAHLFEDADLSVATLEGTITANASIAQRDHTILRFTFDEEFTKAALAPLRLSFATLANNHSLDFYRAGYDTTRAHLVAWGIEPFGHPNNAPELLSAKHQVQGKEVCMVGYHQLYDPDTTSVHAEIVRLRPVCDYLIVMPHWGPEYEPLPSDAQVAIGHGFIDAGADVVMGSHPHVVQTLEVYRGRPIFYSLGNFMFDQEFSWETMHGLVVAAEFGEEEWRFVLYPTEVVQARVSVASEEARQRVLKALVASLSEDSAATVAREGVLSLPVARPARSW